MGQITNTNSLHLIQNKTSNSFWYADYSFYFQILKEDFFIYLYLQTQCKLKYNILKRKHIYEVEIIKSCIYRAKQTIILNVELIYLKNKNFKKKNVKHFIKELFMKLKHLSYIKNNFFLLSYKVGKHTAKFTALRIATLLEKRIKFKSKSVEKLIKTVNSIGIRITCKGRLNFVDRAKKDKIAFGSVPLQVLSANVDYGFVVANTQKGLQSIKVWILYSK
uniref:Ribosomal protein S3 n=1 Tax=Chroomonas placoidea TaxID=173977 RepID=A0A2P1G835_9CRYP|nr:ribosomal protein S3 [Chroomonas placoidea]AVM81125.1 ribosomal protein S3 [Chroomonas placoidea]